MKLAAKDDSSRSIIRDSRRWVIKIGSALLTQDGKGLDRDSIEQWVEQIAQLANAGYEIVIVSSGSVAAGMSRLGWKHRPVELNKLQAAAAVGQSSLVRCYEDAFAKFGITTAQILLDHDDLSDRKRYLNARSTLRTLASLNVIPVVNENDTVVTDEIRFGDNDTLAALVANLIEAETLCILTDQRGMFTANPKDDPDAKMIAEVRADEAKLDQMAGDGGPLGRGGMQTKVNAARVAARSGTNTIIVGGKLGNIILELAQGKPLGTLLTANTEPMAAKKQWLAGQMKARGTLVLDAGAVRVLAEQGKSLLPVGVISARGEFKRGDLVICSDEQGREIARGLVGYNSVDAQKIIGKPSSEIEKLLGYKDLDAIIHRDNMVITG